MDRLPGDKEEKALPMKTAGSTEKSKAAPRQKLEQHHNDNELIAASFHGDLEKVQRLVQNGAEIEAKDGRYQATPLHLASWNGHKDVISLLMESGANKNAQDKHGKTPLHCACRKGNEEVMKLLLEKGADPTITNNKGRTPLQVAQEHNKQNCIDAIESFLERQNKMNHLQERLLGSDGVKVTKISSNGKLRRDSLRMEVVEDDNWLVMDRKHNPRLRLRDVVLVSTLAFLLVAYGHMNLNRKVKSHVTLTKTPLFFVIFSLGI